jgi:hypothetical protein
MIGEYSAIIIEPRMHYAFELVLTNILENLDDQWNIIIYHGNLNYLFIDKIINEKLSIFINRITKINLNINNLTIKDYNKILCSKEFYEKIPTEIFLIFQTDSLICPKYKDLIYNYFNYDYVGAPWKVNEKVGNGGLSLRKKSKMIELIDKSPIKNEDGKIQEDYFFSDLCENKPSFELAKEFSIETTYNDKSFGVHKPWLYLTKDELEKIHEYFPELKLLEEKNKCYNIHNDQKKYKYLYLKKKL